jgi:O-succinylbenzoate synthase
MKIERVDLIHLRMNLVSPFETSYGQDFEMDKLILKAYSSGLVAYSECVAEGYPFYAYETVGTAGEILRKFILPSVMGIELRGPEDCWERISRFRGHPMAKAAVENASWILRGLEEGKPLAKLLGGERERVVAGVPIGIQKDAGKLIELIGSYLKKGYPRVKIKIKPGKDLAVVEAVRREFPRVQLMVDANNAYSLDEFNTLKALDSYGLLMVEQPLAHDDIVDHAKLQSRMETPICLDESIHGPYEARVAAELKACRIINIKQGRVGGLLPAREIHRIAEDRSMGVWCGSMLETGIGQAVNLALAALPNFVYPNDIHESELFWEKDLVDPPVVLNSDGTVTVPAKPGLGVEVDEDALDHFTVAREVIRSC